MKFVPRNHKEIKSLSMSEVNRLNKIFIENGWPKETSFDNHIFDNFCETLAQFNTEQRELILALTEKFIWIQPEKYTVYFDNLFSDFTSNYNFNSESEPESNNKMTKVILCPLLSSKDTNKIKSSTTLVYLIKGQIRAMQKKYNKYNIGVMDSPSIEEILKINKDGNATFCLIDDFLGTGQTAKEAVIDLINKGVNKKNIVVLVLVGMEKGIDILKSDNISVFANFTCKKGISGDDNNKKQEETMNDIEKIIGVKKKYKFGYNSCEALVRMIRTPNNTFPFFWLYNETKHKAPFPR